ncbi:hypothetical protein C2G38_2256643 [Gigaspora rosea]|uniref:RING-type domain-containing protein n=1 Tax=Gigaspora rosea TaxID=44941 RepID=A0A397TSX7_9GLOM|nr:hypothetical protein C2G38_2256643 [Gigaspora rosea]
MSTDPTPQNISCLKTLALNILKNSSPDVIAKDVEIPELDPCSRCKEELFLYEFKKPFTTLICGHIFHRRCLEDYVKDLPQCPKCAIEIESIDYTHYSGTFEQSTSDPMQISPQMTSSQSQNTITPDTTLIFNPTLAYDPTIYPNYVDLTKNKDASQIESRNCSKCSEVISPEILKPVILLPCNHVVHFECIDNKRKLCPECPSIDYLEKEGYYISPIVLANETPKKKRKMQEKDTHKSKSKRATKPKAIIRELSVASTSSGPSISAPSETTNIGEISNQFHKLYYDVDIAEKKGDQENQEVVQCYFRFGRALSERLAVLLKNNPPQTAHTKLNKEVKEKLPEKTKDAIVRKRTDMARKIYDIFSKIGEDKIKNIRSFTASSFSDLTRDEVSYIIKNFPV